MQSQVVTHATSMKKILLLITLAAFAYQVTVTSAEISDSLLDAIEFVESNGRVVSGDGGRSNGSFQLSRAAVKDVQQRTGWQHTYKTVTASRAISRQYAGEFLRLQSARFTRATKRKPTVGDLYALYNCGYESYRRKGFDQQNLPTITKRAIKKLKTQL